MRRGDRQRGMAWSSSGRTLLRSRGAIVPTTQRPAAPGRTPQALTFTLNGRAVSHYVEPAVTLLDLLRERAGLTGTKKGCDRGQCGACTVLVNGRRTLSCLALALAHDGR